MCTGDCTWKCLGGANWAKTSDPCDEGCFCFAPTHKGMIGDTDTTDCNSDAPRVG